MGAATFVADPAGDADVETDAKVVLQLVLLTGKAVSDCARSQRAGVLSQNGDKVFVRVALVQEHGLADSRRNLERPGERGTLHVARREIAEVIQTAFADGYDFRLMREPFELVRELIGELRGVMRMNPGGGVQGSRMR